LLLSSSISLQFLINRSTNFDCKNNLQTLTMRFFGADVLLLASSTVSADRSSLRGLVESRTEVVVNFEFQLEVKKRSQTGTTTDILQLIDGEILPSLQATLPNGGTSGPDDEPGVKFESIGSEIFSACFTTSDQCSLIKSNVLVSYEGVRPEDSVELVTLKLVQNFLEQYGLEDNNVLITYMYPSTVSTLTQFSIGPVKGPMGDIEVMVLEKTFEEVFGAIVFAIEGDTEVMNAKFLYQDIFDGESEVIDQSKVTQQKGNTVQTDLLVQGKCRDCTSTQFGIIVGTVIENNLAAYQNTLRLNGKTALSEYFDDITSLTFAVPQLPESLPPIKDDSIFDSEAPETENKQPWFLFFGLVLGLCVFLGGTYCVCKDKTEMEMEKDENFSTSGSSGSDGEEEDDDEEDDDEKYGEEATYDEEDFQVETVARDDTTTEFGKDDPQYEVYVF
jgi:hypothetical protein